MIPAAIYTRISHDPGCDRLGVRRQERECRELAARQGWEVQDVFEDDDISAYRPGRRPAFNRLLGDLEAGALTALVVWHPDRLYRHLQELERLVTICEQRRVQVATVTAGSIDLSSASGRMVARILGVTARAELERMVERIRAKHRELAETGKRPGGGSRPYGYDQLYDSQRRPHVRLVVRETEAARIREAAQRVLGGESLSAIVRDWDGAGVPSAAADPVLDPYLDDPVRWSPTALRNVLSSARISGRREVYSDETGRRLTIGRITCQTADWPAIIDVAQSDRLRAFLGAPGRLRSSFAQTHLLTGIARCGACGQPLIAQGSVQGGRHLRRIGCSKLPNARGCGKVSTVAEPFEGLVTEAVLRRVESPGVLAALRRRDDAFSLQAMQELQTVQAQQQQLAQEWAGGSLDLDAWKAARKLLDDRRRSAERRLQGASAVTLPADIRSAWTRMPLSARRSVLRTVVDSIDLAPATVRGRNAFDPSRVSIRWRV